MKKSLILCEHGLVDGECRRCQEYDQARAQATRRPAPRAAQEDQNAKAIQLAAQLAADAIFRKFFNQ